MRITRKPDTKRCCFRQHLFEVFECEPAIAVCYPGRRLRFSTDILRHTGLAGVLEILEGIDISVFQVKLSNIIGSGLRMNISTVVLKLARKQCDPLLPAVNYGILAREFHRRGWRGRSPQVMISHSWQPKLHRASFIAIGSGVRVLSAGLYASEKMSSRLYFRNSVRALCPARSGINDDQSTMLTPVSAWYSAAPAALARKPYPAAKIFRGNSARLS